MQSEYFAIRAARTLGVPQEPAEELVVLAAARLGKARLIDNLKVR
jgi:pantoate--beta-alanine ligase